MTYKLPEGWKEVKLGDAIQFNPRESIKKGTISKKIGMGQLGIFQRKIVGFEIEEYKSGTKFRNGDTLLARITPSLENGKTAQVTVLDEEEIGFGSTEYIVLREKENFSTNNFIYYLAISSLIRDIAIKSMTGTTGRQRAQIEVIKNTMFNLPSLREQKEIADTLSALDDKIELNNKINKNLEKQAQALFKEWFINFEYPDKNGTPYKSSGGEMIESEIGMIPKGWKISKLGREVEVELGGTPARKNKSYWGGNINWINSGELNSSRIFKETETITETGLKNSSTKLWQKNTTVIAITGATLGKTSLLLIDTCANQSVVGIKENNDIPHTFIYPYIVNKIPKLTGQQTGGAQQHINKGNVEDLILLLPNSDILMKYDNNIKMHYQYIETNEFENIYLSQLRDTLLPKLMSGEIRIPLELEV